MADSDSDYVNIVPEQDAPRSPRSGEAMRRRIGSDGDADVLAKRTSEYLSSTGAYAAGPPRMPKAVRAIAFKATMMAAVVFLNTGMGIMMRLSSVDGEIPFNTSVIVFLAEGAKFLFSFFSVLRTRASASGPGEAARRMRMCDPLGRITLRGSLPYAVPAVLYALNNNLLFYIYTYLDPASAQVLGNLKIVWTVLLLKYALGRRLTRTHYVAVAALVSGPSSNFCRALLQID